MNENSGNSQQTESLFNKPDNSGMESSNSSFEMPEQQNVDEDSELNQQDYSIKVLTEIEFNEVELGGKDVSPSVFRKLFRDYIIKKMNHHNIAIRWLGKCQLWKKNIFFLWKTQNTP